MRTGPHAIAPSADVPSPATARIMLDLKPTAALTLAPTLSSPSSTSSSSSSASSRSRPPPVAMTTTTAAAASGPRAPRQSRPQHRVSKYKRDLSPRALELRRKHNRESMQRARQRERAELERLRGQLAQLELQYREASARHGGGDDDSSGMIRHDGNGDDNPRVAEYNALSALSKDLKRENFALQRALDARRQISQRMEAIVQGYYIEKRDIGDDDSESDDDRHRAPAPIGAAALGLPPMTDAQACELIRESCELIARIERTTVPLANAAAGFFGWNVRQQIVNDSNIRFIFCKSFPNVHPARAMELGWEIYSSTEHNNLKSVRVLRLDVLQEINHDTQVIVRDIAHPLDKGIVLRTLMLRFRIKTERGFVAGRWSMNPSTPPTEPHVRYADVTSWVEFAYADPRRPDLPGCRVKFGGFCDYRTNRDLSARFISVLSTVLKMEERCLQSQTRFLPPS